MIPAEDYNELRNRMYEVEKHIGKADSLLNGRANDEIKKVVLMQIAFDDLFIHVHHQGVRNDRCSFDEFRSFLVEEAAAKEE